MAVVQSLQALLDPLVMILMLGGSLLGVIFGAIPGLSGPMCLMLMLPITYSMNPNMAIAFLMSIYIGGISGGCIGSILIGVPGQASSLATTYDGYAMTKKGECVRAMSAAVVANFLGTVPSVLIASVASRALARVAVSIGPWEFFGLGVCAITLVIGLSKGDVLKGLIAAALGLAITCVGMAPIDGAQRFSYSNIYLLGGLPLTGVFMGIFVPRTLMLEFAKKDPKDELEPAKISKFKWPKQDLLNNKLNILRSWFTGLWIGFLPGMGAALSNLTAYAQAKNASKHPEEFGTGIVDGVIAPEVANNASTGGAMIPLLSLGIPGDTSSAFLLGGLAIHGVITGPLLFTDYPVIGNIILLASMFAGIMIFIMEVVGMPLFPKLLKIPYHYLGATIFLFCIIGVYASANLVFDVWMFFIFSVIGIIVAYAELPTGPLALAFVLGKLLETNLRRGLQYSSTGFLIFFTRPISAILLLVAIGSVLYPLIKDMLKKRKEQKIHDIKGCIKHENHRG